MASLTPTQRRIFALLQRSPHRQATLPEIKAVMVTSRSAHAQHGPTQALAGLERRGCVEPIIAGTGETSWRLVPTHHEVAEFLLLCPDETATVAQIRVKTGGRLGPRLALEGLAKKGKVEYLGGEGDDARWRLYRA